MRLDPSELIFIPLGGSEQFGCNLNVYAYQNKLLAVDLGMGFADEYYPGIDILLPDPQFLEDRADDLLGLVITHAHEDHIGAISHLWPRLGCPIYCSPFTASVIRKKLAENPECSGADVRVIQPNKQFSLGPFDLTALSVTHSIPGAYALVVETDLGRVLHSGDWNLDPKPVIGKPINDNEFKALGEQGVLAYVGDSTNAGVDGYSGSESNVEQGLARVFKECEQRIVVTTFASNIGRIRSICKAAQACDRHVAVLGRSLHRMIGCAQENGYLTDVPDFISEEDIGLIPRDQIVVIATGSQGEARAQMAKIARGDQRSLKLDPGDTVIFSARPIPGNEKEILFVQNRLAAAQVNVITPRDSAHCIHVSGHPARDEIKQMYDWVKPQIVVPVHGEKLMIGEQAELARTCQIKQVVAPNNGSVVKLAPGTAEIIDHVETSLLAVEPGRIISAAHPAIGERRKLQYSGTVHVTLVVDQKVTMLAEPQISMVGLLDEQNDDDLDFIEDLKDDIFDLMKSLKKRGMKNTDDVAEQVRISVRRSINDVLGIKPKVLVHVVGV